ncbi:YjbH domain-containing protein [Marinomonas algarum]|uniref:YjbH domain-containing protein n=1 Tax=Marinomonas algarum TaxID=2883105 RepID=A0A9X1LCI9_9GAMM|nr:YjbH domain-containing protein [Marinomonas algarum]MCB5161532.1 YjbH domain-containing protein [Marinomonas algarum]
MFFYPFLGRLNKRRGDSYRTLGALICMGIAPAGYAQSIDILDESAPSNKAPVLVKSTPFQTPSLTPTQSDLGGVGLLQMPTGRMAEEGMVSIGYNHNSEYQFFTLSLQVMPWLETTLRYTQVEDLLYSDREEFSGDTKLADKGIDAKLRLWTENQWRPEVSVGLRDLGGTGLFDGEFIAASKRLSTDHYGELDFTLGLGWGYFGTRGTVSNPFCTAGDRFCDRITDSNGNGGSIDYQRWFTGPSSLFGGIEYQTPFEPLSFKLEYDGNDYSQDTPVLRGGIDMTPRSPWNIGAVYALNDNFSLRVGYERGTTTTLGLTFASNFDTIKSPWVDNPIPALGTQQASDLDSVDWPNLTAELSNIAGYHTHKVYQNEQGEHVTLVAQQSKYRDRDMAAERAAAVLANYLPDSVSTYQVVETQKNIPVKSTEISAQGYRDIATVDYFNPNIKDALLTLPNHHQYEITSSEPIYDQFEPFNYNISPDLTQSIGNPESFYLYSVTLEGDASYWLTSNLELSSSVSLNLIDNLDQLGDSLPEDGTDNYRVRTLIRSYIHDNDVYMSNLQLTWFEKYSQNWYQQIYGGYLETMFAGVGTEVLYRRPNANWAIGVDANLIAQRDPSSQFALFESDNAYSPDAKVLSKGTTGHVSLYYQTDFSFMKDFLVQLNVGQFLAADVGARLDVSKQYKSGVIIGAYASKTDMSAEEFGEGSFTKGFYMSIPFDTISIKPNNSRADISWQPLTRDGGQMLDKRNSLFGITDLVAPWYQRPNQN